MKIMLVCPYDFALAGGVKNHVLALAQEFTKKGHFLKIAAPSSNRSTHIEGIDFVRLSKPSRLPFAPHIFLNPFTIFKMRRLLKEEKFDIVHLHEPLLPPLCLSGLFFSKGVTIGTFHSYKEENRRFYHAPLRKWLNRLKGRIAVSPAAKKYHQLCFFGDYKIIPNGVDIDRFSTPKKSPSSSNKIKILFVGHQQSKRKGLHYLLEAYSKLKPLYPSLELMIAGVSLPGRNSPAELRKREFQDVLFLGAVTDDELISLYQSADIFCAPSTQNESFGIVLLEAMAAGVPIVASNIEGYAGVIANEEEGLLVAPKDTYALAQSIEKLINDPILKNKLREKGKIKVQQYAWEKVASQVLDFYQECLKKRDLQ